MKVRDMKFYTILPNDSKKIEEFMGNVKTRIVGIQEFKPISTKEFNAVLRGAASSVTIEGTIWRNKHGTINE